MRKILAAALAGLVLFAALFTIALAGDPPGFGKLLGQFQGENVFSNGLDPSYVSQYKSGYGIEWQCVEFVQRYWAKKGWGPKVWGLNAADMFGASIAGAKSLPNGSSIRPVPGDILIFSQTGAWRFGHVALVTSVTNGQITFAQQNVGEKWTASLPIDGSNHINSQGKYPPVSGWIHSDKNPLNGNPNSQPPQVQAPAQPPPPVQQSRPQPEVRTNCAAIRADNLTRGYHSPEEQVWYHDHCLTPTVPNNPPRNQPAPQPPPPANNPPQFGVIGPPQQPPAVTYSLSIYDQNATQLYQGGTFRFCHRLSPSASYQVKISYSGDGGPYATAYEGNNDGCRSVDFKSDALPGPKQFLVEAFINGNRVDQKTLSVNVISRTDQPIQPAQPPSQPQVRELGGLPNLDAFCRSDVGDGWTAKLRGNVWVCVPPSTETRYAPVIINTSFHMDAACRLQYGPNAWSRQTDPNNGYSWRCYSGPH